MYSKWPHGPYKVHRRRTNEKKMQGGQEIKEDMSKILQNGQIGQFLWFFPNLFHFFFFCGSYMVCVVILNTKNLYFMTILKKSNRLGGDLKTCFVIFQSGFWAKKLSKYVDVLIFVSIHGTHLRNWEKPKILIFNPPYCPGWQSASDWPKHVVHWNVLYK